MTIQILTIDTVTRDTKEAVEMLVDAAERLQMAIQTDIHAVLVRAFPGDDHHKLHYEFVRVRDSKTLVVKIAQLQRREEAA